MVPDIVKNQGGGIRASSEPGQGACFEVFFPGAKTSIGFADIMPWHQATPFSDQAIQKHVFSRAVLIRKPAHQHDVFRKPAHGHFQGALDLGSKGCIRKTDGFVCSLRTHVVRKDRKRNKGGAEFGKCMIENHLQGKAPDLPGLIIDHDALDKDSQTFYNKIVYDDISQRASVGNLFNDPVLQFFGLYRCQMALFGPLENVRTVIRMPLQKKHEIQIFRAGWPEPQGALGLSEHSASILDALLKSQDLTVL